MRITKQIVAITCAVLLLLCMPVSAHTDEELNEMSGEFLDIRNEIRALAQNIHDESEYIADDEALDPEIRDVAEEVHQMAHRIDRSAHDIRHYIDDGDYNQAKAELEVLKGLIIDLNNPVHKLDDIAPESHKHHADEVHHDLHDLQRKYQDFEGLFYEFLTDRLLELRNEIRAIAQDIHDESEYIADDESLDTEIRDLAEWIHQQAHKIDRSAHDIRHYIDDGNYNEAKAELDNLKSFIIELNGPVHELDHEVPESHKQHADEIHHDLHDLQHVFQKFESLFYTYIGDREYTEETNADSGDVPINERLLEIRNEIRALAQNIHDESEYIADDEALDPEIRDVAEEVHQLSHKIDRSAHDIRHYIDDGEVDKARNEMTNLRSLVVSLNSLAHELDDITPESHKHHADEVHHDMHALQHKLDDFSQLFDEWVQMNHADYQGHAVAEEIPEESQAESMPGFEAIFAITGLLAVAFLIRKL
ncbi:hypothetical protein Mzhil_1935 [Methanosalsum zhilinae DSM 4017]|uniref:PGF-CTERM archaeal protein-sorting signal domain-containing protein n=1 Tax=Methanosalsum zhilinae (strain DSM 4017 / NBRC 107636 / OCM 62 / WeN5) TaxID=679901 RepID=F7XKQ7_METZD|nr:PGF-CTERM sorting domain-containing protein [Methanosalsum zhilinae]AEH61770.1 hypothetical protein Mzhil_1935 [Methanosalsum zhilinae DSM 4017]